MNQTVMFPDLLNESDSAVGSGQRDGRDFYPTPADLCRAALDLIEDTLPSSVLDPGAGTGAWGWAVQDKWPDVWLAGVDKHFGNPGPYNKWWMADFTQWGYGQQFDVVVGNPPFSLSQPFIEQALRYLKPGGELLFLLPLNFLASQTRNFYWWKSQPLWRVYVMGRRPSFSGDGKTDAYEYALYHFVKGYKGQARIIFGWDWKE